MNFVAGKDQGVQIHIDGEKIKLGSNQAREALAIASRVEAELNRIINAFNLHTHASHGAVSLASIASAGLIATTKVVAE